MHTADPIWPVIVLAAIQAADAILCLKPVTFVAQCLEDVNLPRRWWKVLSPLKAASATGLLAGVWWAPIGVLSGAALTVYFTVAISAHLRAGDIGRNLGSATGMLTICVAVTYACFLR